MIIPSELADLFKIRYRHPGRTPIQLLASLDQQPVALCIDCCFQYNRRALQPDQSTGRIPADIIEAGIIQGWSGTYQLELPALEGQPLAVAVSVAIRRGKDRRAVPVKLRRLLLMPAHVISPFYRRFWGICKTGHLESMGTNWSLTQPGGMILPLGLDDRQLASVAAHEAGHLFGLGDAYAAFYRFYDPVPEAEQFMMFSNQTVQPAEILMLLKAHTQGRMQFFPLRWQTRRFLRGLRQDLAARARQLQRQWSESRPASRRKSK